MDPTTILYALSTMAQTCAALAALVGALGLYRLQSIRSRRAEVEREMRQMLVGVTHSWEGAQGIPIHTLVDRDAPNFVQSASGADDPGPRMQRFLDEWGRLDPDYRRTSKLLGLFTAWNLSVIGVSLVGFAFVHQIAWSSLPVVGLWVLTVGTVLATAIMAVDVRGSFVARFGHVHWLEDG